MVIVDHKTKPVPESMWEPTAKDFAGQIRDYKTILEAQGLDVAECWIHLPLGGGMVQVSVE